MIAHRGLSSLYPDNSVAAFEAAGQSDFFWGIETDVWYIGGEWVLSHDRPGSLAGLPRLEEFLEITDRYGKVGVLDIKSTLSVTEVTLLLELTEDHEVMYISHIVANVDRIKAQQPDAHTQVVYLYPNNINTRHDQSFYHSYLTQTRIDSAKSAGVEVSVWTVNNKAEAQRFVNMGVDYLTTDFIFR
jgi:glycerophosphoryl diester phosphodiesterase